MTHPSNVGIILCNPSSKVDVIATSMVTRKMNVEPNQNLKGIFLHVINNATSF